MSNFALREDVQRVVFKVEARVVEAQAAVQGEDGGHVVFC